MLKSNKKSNLSAKALASADEIYLDNASATPVDKSVILVMNDVLKKSFANSSAIHNLGVISKNKLEQARKEVSSILKAHSDEIIFTSGATESNNLAILGVINAGKINFLQGSRKGVSQTIAKSLFFPHLVTTNIEHSSVLETCRYLEKTKQAEVTYVPVEKNGIVDPKKIRKAIKSNTILVSVMYANNEIGTIQPIQEIAKEIRHFKKPTTYNLQPRTYPLFHTDATQAINYLPIKVEKLGIDLMSFNGGKIYGPKGVGALFVKRKTPINKIMFGGEQEFGFRPGTENVASIVGLAEALKITEEMKEKEVKRLTKLRDYFIDEIFKNTTNSAIAENIVNYKIIFNGDLEKRLPNNVNISIPKIPSDLLVLEFSARGIYISEKSACKSGDKKGSYVIEAISPKNKGSLRFSLGRQTTKADIIYVIKALSEILKKLKRWYT